MSPTLSGYTPVRAKQFYKQLLERVSALPGVSGDGVRADGPARGQRVGQLDVGRGLRGEAGREHESVLQRGQPRLLQDDGHSAVAGRDFDDRDARYEAPDPNPNLPPPYKVAIVNESYAKHYFGDRSPIGRHIGFGMNPGTKTPIEIIGVVKDAKYTGVRDDIPRQVFFAFMENDFAGGAVMYVRTTSQPDAAFGADPPGGAPARREHPDVQPAHARRSRSISRC